MAYRSSKTITDARNYIVVKANELIQKTRFNLTLQEQKILLFITSKLQPTDMMSEDLVFEITEFCRVCGIDLDNGKNYADIKKSLKNLRDKSIWLQVNENTEITFSWLSRVGITAKSGKITVRFDDFTLPFLLNLRCNFTSYELRYILAMQSQYSIRLYELLKSYSYQTLHIVEIELLKKALFAENYTTWQHFKSRVLDIATREINTFSDIKVSYTPIKEGRKFVEIKFLIEPKKDIDERVDTWKQIDKALNTPKLTLSDSDLG